MAEAEGTKKGGAGYENNPDDWSGQATGIDWLTLTKMHCDALVPDIPLSEGMAVLDVAAGTGAFALGALEAMAVAKIGSGRVVITDFAEGMLTQCRGNLAKRKEAGELPDGVEIEVQQASALELPYDDASYDVVLCGFGLFLMPDPTKATQECLRVLKPGGRLLFTSWHDVAALHAMEELFSRIGAPASTSAPLREPIEVMDGPEAIQAVLTATGIPCSLVRSEKVERSWHFDGEPEAGAAILLANPVLKRPIHLLEETQREQCPIVLAEILATDAYNPWVNTSWTTVVAKS